MDEWWNSRGQCRSRRGRAGRLQPPDSLGVRFKREVGERRFIEWTDQSLHHFGGIVVEAVEVQKESASDPEAHSAADAYGLMQLVEPTARMYAKKAGLPWDAAALKRPAVNIALGCRVLAKLNTLFADVPELSIPGYNAGPNRPRRWRRERAGLDFDLWVELIPLTETRRYTKRVLASRAAYAVLYDPEHADQALRLPLNLATAP